MIKIVQFYSQNDKRRHYTQAPLSLSLKFILSSLWGPLQYSLSRWPPMQTRATCTVRPFFNSITATRCSLLAIWFSCTASASNHN